MQSALSGLYDRVAGMFRKQDSFAKTVIAGICVLVFAALLFWTLNEVLILALSRSYVEQIAVAFNLNRHLAEAISLGVFVALSYFLSRLLSLSATNRRIGYTGLLCLLIINSLALWQGTKDHYFEASGKAAKCYVITREGVRYLEKAGIDPVTGKSCTLVTPDAMDKLLAYTAGRRPEKIDVADPVFFDPRTGAPNVWYARNKANEIELFDLMGFHPETGLELSPVQQDVAAEWKRQQKALAERAPQRVDPERFVFFDTKTGKSRGWYWRSADGVYEFYDNAGFQPNTGERLLSVSREVLADWRDQSAKKCYILTKTSLKYGITVGLDATTGLECKPITASLLERLREYEKGNRPKLVKATEPVFFDPRSGEPAIWYGKDASGQIQFFDLIGFHPDTGQELQPVTASIVAEWRRQIDVKTRRPPQLVDINQYAPFDPTNGKPRVWFWRGREGPWEFYDNDGFQPGTGDKLTLISREVLEAWVREKENLKRRQAEEEARRRAAEAKALEAQKVAAAQEALEQQAGDTCDRLAANPTDARKPASIEGVEYKYLKNSAQAAVESCSTAVRVFPTESRYSYQLARALEFSDSKRAANMYSELARQGYAAAYDNLAGIVLWERKDRSSAIALYEKGVQLGDASAMVSVAYLIQKGWYQTPNADPNIVRFKLLSRAAEKGRRGARETLEGEQAAYQQKLQDQENQRAAQQMMLNFFGSAIGAAVRR